MSYNIDLKELSIRESEKVEWKENGDDKNILTQLLTSKQEVIPFDKRANPNVGVTGSDILLFRDCMSETKLIQPLKPVEDYFSDSTIRGVGYPNHFSNNARGRLP